VRGPRPTTPVKVGTRSRSRSSPMGEPRSGLNDYQSAATSCRPSRHASLPSLGGTSTFTRSFRSAADECAAEAGSWSPGSSGRDVVEETTGSPKVPGRPRLSVCACSTPTPAGPHAPDRYSAAAWPWVIEQPRLPRGDFRRSIAWLPDSLFTLRRTGYPIATPNSLPAVGQTLLGGLCTRKVPTEGFRALVSSHPPSPSLLGAID